MRIVVTNDGIDLIKTFEKKKIDEFESKRLQEAMEMKKTMMMLTSPRRRQSRFTALNRHSPISDMRINLGENILALDSMKSIDLYNTQHFHNRSDLGSLRRISVLRLQNEAELNAKASQFKANIPKIRRSIALRNNLFFNKKAASSHPYSKINRQANSLDQLTSKSRESTGRKSLHKYSDKVMKKRQRHAQFYNRNSSDLVHRNDTANRVKYKHSRHLKLQETIFKRLKDKAINSIKERSEAPGYKELIGRFRKTGRLFSKIEEEECKVKSAYQEGMTRFYQQRYPEVFNSSRIKTRRRRNRMNQIKQFLTKASRAPSIEKNIGRDSKGRKK